MDSIHMDGFIIESDFFDGDDFYINAVIQGKPTLEKIHAASDAVMAMANQMCYAMNGSSGHQSGDDGAWVVYEEEWWGKNGEMIEDEDDVYLVKVVQRTIRR